MELKTITLLSEDEYTKYESIIPNADWYWWLKTPYPGYDDCVRVVDSLGNLDYYFCNDIFGGVRPFCIFNLESTNPLFWYKPESLVGSKIKYGKYSWTVLDVKNGELHALCDEIVARRRFDENTNIWETSELKAWLETECLKLITS